MELLKNQIRKKGISDIFQLISFLLSIAALILYVNTGSTSFHVGLESSVILPLIFILVIEALMLVCSFKLGKYMAFVLYLFAFVEYISSQVNLIANVFVSIDGTRFSAGFIFCMISFLFGLITSLVSGILAPDETKAMIDAKKKNNGGQN